MPRIIFAPAIQRHVPASASEVAAASVRAALEEVFRENPPLRGYVLDEQDQLRRHVAIFVDGRRIRDSVHLSDPVGTGSEIYVVQALSGG